MMNKFTIDLNVEYIDEIMKQRLIEDYRGMISDIIRLETIEEPLQEYQEEDLADFKKWASAMETILKYYIFVDEAQDIINEETLRRDLLTSKVYIEEDVCNEDRIAMLEEQVKRLMENSCKCGNK
jgi:hypothetical protein